MIRSSRSLMLPATLLLSLILTACGGGGSATTVDNTPPAANSPPSSNNPFEASAPALTGDTATDGFNRFNYRRQQMGLAALTRNSRIDTAAVGHSNYQRVNDVITHDQIAGRPAFTGAMVPDRLNAAGYTLPASGYAYGEVISASGDLSGSNNAEDLITAIYHRFVVFEPKFHDAGAGSVGLSASGYNFFTVEFGTTDLLGGLGTGRFAVYPFPNQTNIVTNFLNYQETPDPLPGQRGAGYPISVHADITTRVDVTTFTVQPRGGQPLATKLLSNVTDPAETPRSVAAIIPLSVLAPATTYDVQFVGAVSGVPVSRSWSFTTR